MQEEVIPVPRWILERMFETYRMLDNTYDFRKRESCLARNVMRDYCNIADLLKDGKINSEKQLTYYMRFGNPK